MYARNGRGRTTTGLPVTDRRGRAIGRILGDEYHKTVLRPDQMLHSPPGFGFDAWAMERLVLPRVQTLVVTCRFNRKVYRVSAETFRRSRMAINRGAGEQYALPLSYWHEDGATATPTPASQTAAGASPPHSPPPSPAAVQGRLF